jgi:photosystem II stability/assembly factor-like uncharacterized protein
MKVSGTSTIIIVTCLVLTCLLAGCGGESTRPPAQGLVYVGSLPGRALIHVDAISTGKLTPDSLFVHEGNHTLTLTLDGYRDSTVSFSIARTDTLSLDIKLVPLEGTLRWVKAPDVTATIFGVDFAAPPNHFYGCAVGENGRVFRTSDGGTSWIERFGGTGENLLSVSFVAPSIGWACGTNGVIVKTTDYGDSWAPMPSPTNKDLHDIFFVNASNGWAVGDSGKILRSTDGGLSWDPRNSTTTKNLSAVYFFSTTLGWAVGGYEPGEGQVILRTTNGGVTWSQRPVVTTSCLRDVLFITSEIGICVGDDGLVLRSTNGGISWDSMRSMGPLSLRAIAAWNNVDCWIVGDRYGASGHVLKSIDGGLSWYPFEEIPQALYCVDAIQGVPSGWAGGVGGLWGYR